MYLENKIVNFSVILPVHNKEPHLSRCINSILNQTHSQFEIIAIDDNSTDGSYEKLCSYGDSRIRLFRRNQSGSGGYAARNLGLEKSKFSWIAFIDADDEWLPNHLEKMNNLIISQNSEIGIIGAGFISVSQDKEIIQKYYLKNFSKGFHYLNLKDVLSNYIKEFRFGNTSVMVVNKNSILNIGGFPAGKTDKGGDLLTWIKILSKAKGIWSPHLGCRTYHNSVNKVTHNNYFDTKFFKKTITELDIDEDTRNKAHLYLNHLFIKDYLKKLKKNEDPPFILHEELYFTNSLEMIYWTILDMLPSIITKNILILRNKILFW